MWCLLQDCLEGLYNSPPPEPWTRNSGGEKNLSKKKPHVGPGLGGGTSRGQMDWKDEKRHKEEKTRHIDHKYI